MSCSSVEKEKDLVRQEYKRYKQKKPIPSFQDVIDFTKPEKFTNKIQELSTASSRLKYFGLSDKIWNQCGLLHPTNWRVFELNTSPGLLFVPNPFKPGGQMYWSKQALTNYAKKPFPCNVDVHMTINPNKTYWEASLDTEDSEKFMEKLRWFHLGYHFDYNCVDYKQKRYFGFPSDLALLMKCIAMALGFTSYVPQTAIINYYPIGSSMGGHTDHYEEELNEPLLSVSFGQSAVFLIGGPTRDIKPEAIWLRSGDIIIMSGAARVAFHAVPCIVENAAVGELLREPVTCSYCKNGENYAENTSDSKSIFTNKEVPAAQCKAQMESKEDITLKLISESSKRCKNMKPELFSGNSDNTGCDPVEHEQWCYCRCSTNSDFDIQKFKKYMSKTRININVRQVHCQ